MPTWRAEAWRRDARMGDSTPAQYWAAEQACRRRAHRRRRHWDWLERTLWVGYVALVVYLLIVIATLR
jgi:hypothetical protein